MSLKDTFSQAPSPKEEALYKRVLNEMDAGIVREGIWAKALADCLGDEKKAHSLYIKYRVQSLADEKKYEAKHIAFEKKLAKKEAIELEERNKRLAEEAKKLAKEQYKKDNAHNGFFKKLKDGYYGLTVTFWIFVFIGLSVVNSLVDFLAWRFQDAAVVFYLLLMVYSAIITVGVWNSTKRYDGFKIWSILAKIFVILSFIFTVSWASINISMFISL